MLSLFFCQSLSHVRHLKLKLLHLRILIGRVLVLKPTASVRVLNLAIGTIEHHFARFFLRSSLLLFSGVVGINSRAHILIMVLGTSLQVLGAALHALHRVFDSTLNIGVGVFGPWRKLS